MLPYQINIIPLKFNLLNVQRMHVFGCEDHTNCTSFFILAPYHVCFVLQYMCFVLQYLKDFGTYPVTPVSDTILVFIILSYNWSDTKRSTVNWYRGLLCTNLYSMVSVCLYALLSSLVYQLYCTSLLYKLQRRRNRSGWSGFGRTTFSG